MVDNRMTFSFVDQRTKDFIRWGEGNQEGQVIQVMATDHSDADYKMFKKGIVDDSSWDGNSVVCAWCWEEMR